MKKFFLILTILAGVLLIIIASFSKEIYDGDELYSYTLSNASRGMMVDNIKLNEWNSSSNIKKVFELNNNEIFNIIPIYKNQASDVHPPFYYLIFHIISIFFLNTFSILPGIIINIIAYIIACIYLYKMSDELEIKYSFMPVILYTLSVGMISTAMFLRMYMLLTMFCLMFTYYFIKIFKNDNKSDFIKLSICVYFGFMTHYFFLVYAFFISFIYTIYLLIKKKNIFNYVKSMFIPIILGFITFPFAYIHIFKGYRGNETTENLVKSNFIDNFKSIYERLNQDIFYGIMIGVILLSIILIIKLIKYKKSNASMNIVMISTLLYFLITLKIIPILSTRYFYSIYPIIILIIYYLIDKSIKNKYIKYSIVIILLGLSIISKISYSPSWIGKSNLGNKNINVVYIIDNDYNTITDSQYLIKYNRVYYTNKEFDDYSIINDNVIIKTEDTSILDKIIENTEYNTYEKEDFGYRLK